MKKFKTLIFATIILLLTACSSNSVSSSESPESSNSTPATPVELEKVYTQGNVSIKYDKEKDVYECRSHKIYNEVYYVKRENVELILLPNSHSSFELYIYSNSDDNKLVVYLGVENIYA